MSTKKKDPRRHAKKIERVQDNQIVLMQDMRKMANLISIFAVALDVLDRKGLCTVEELKARGAELGEAALQAKSRNATGEPVSEVHGGPGVVGDEPARGDVSEGATGQIVPTPEVQTEVGGTEG